MGKLNILDVKIDQNWSFLSFSESSYFLNFECFWDVLVIRLRFSGMFSCPGLLPELSGIPRELKHAKLKLTPRMASYTDIVWSCTRSRGFSWSWKQDHSPQDTYGEDSWKHQLKRINKLWEQHIQLTGRQIWHFSKKLRLVPQWPRITL